MSPKRCFGKGNVSDAAGLTGGYLGVGDVSAGTGRPHAGGHDGDEGLVFAQADVILSAVTTKGIEDTGIAQAE
jgi:hypothetical protein